jgi:dihydrolipoamide dehydrogenase
VEVETSDGSTRCTRRSTSSWPRVPAPDLPFLEIDGEKIWSSDDALFAKEAPETLAIVGAGAIGMEFADIFEAYGSKVTIIEALDRVLPVEDKESRPDGEGLQEAGNGHPHRSPTWRRPSPEKKGVTLTFKDKKGETQTLEVDRVLSAVGRFPTPRAWAWTRPG